MMDFEAFTRGVRDGALIVIAGALLVIAVKLFA